jgi:hypothetical protein
MVSNFEELQVKDNEPQIAQVQQASGTAFILKNPG